MPSHDVLAHRRVDAAYKARKRVARPPRLVRRFPIGPLLDLMAAEGVTQIEMNRHLSEMFDGRRIRFGRTHLSEHTADLAAVALSRHPGEIWPDLWCAYEQQEDVA